MSLPAAPVALAALVARFAVDGGAVELVPVAGGHINDSFLVTLDTGRRVFLQRINDTVYPDPRLLMDNVSRITDHVRRVFAARGVPDLDRRVLRLVPGQARETSVRDETGGWWRLYHAVEGVRTLDRVDRPEQGLAAGRAFGTFLEALNADGGVRLAETIPRFHDTPHRYAALDQAIAEDPQGRVADTGPEIDGVMGRREGASVLVDLQRAGKLPERSVHNDTKSTNVLLDAASGEALCVVDLDNAMPGTPLHDFGDMVRSMTSPTDEDETDLSRVGLRLPLFEAIARGWLGAVAPLLGPAERAHLVTAGLVITLEQGVRFLTDFLLGDVYYKTVRPAQNLDRCRTQLRLVESLEAQRRELEDVVTRCGGGA